MLPNCDPAKVTPLIGPAWLKTTVGETPRKAPLRQFTLLSVTCLTIWLPPRSIVNGTLLPALCFWMASPICLQLCTGCPATATILSPDFSPARAAGDRGSLLTHPAVWLA